MKHTQTVRPARALALSMTALAGLAGPVFAPSALAQTASDAEDAPLMDVITVTGRRGPSVATQTEIPDLAPPANGPDATALLARAPGGARVGNGPLSGQAQYRGLFGPRLNLRVDGQRFASGGPNLMDPPLHYAPTPLIAAIEVDRGISPVSAGPGLAGGANTVFKRIDFATGPEAQFGYDVTTIARSADESIAVGGVAGAATDRLRFNVLASSEEGENTQIPDGEIASSAYSRDVYGASAGARLGEGHELGLDLRRQETGPSGNPPFPMDIRFMDTDFARLTYAGDLGAVRLQAELGYVDVGHAMNNFDLRPAPANPAQYRETLAYATTRTARLAARTDLGSGELMLGVDGERAEHDVRITNPNNAAFFIASLPDIEIERAGAFAQWTGPLGPASAELGVRVDNTRAEAGLASVGPAVPAMPGMLAMAFNAADRTAEDTTVDAAARVWIDAGDGMTWRATLARKTRTPGYLERFAWLPTQASGGLADGNVYVGDLGLDPETAWIAEAGFDWASGGAYLRPTAFIRQVDDYIQGVPFDATPGVADTPQEMVSTMNGDPTPLRFANVDARLYGVDLDAGVRLSPRWRLDATASWVRGERRDIDDNLYRVSPPSLTAGLTYEAAVWSATLETRLVADQNDVSATNSEAATDGYGVVNLHAEWEAAEGVRLSAGVENLFDADYADHLSGYNRVAGSDVALGARVPGPGRGAYLRLNLTR